MVHEYIDYAQHILFNVVFKQLLNYGNYCGVGKPIWTNDCFEIDEYYNLFKNIKPIDDIDRICMIYKIECLLLEHHCYKKKKFNYLRQAHVKCIRRLRLVDTHCYIKMFYKQMIIILMELKLLLINLFGMKEVYLFFNKNSINVSKINSFTQLFKDIHTKEINLIESS